ncbi:MAG TPA: class I SAM-dependent methyltransferase [Salinarimonas sp.]|nr:class I SAM-dependent methyltransferase [Salinarimonas sp.]
MAEIFDTYSEAYEAQVERSIAFSGLGHDFFLAAKVEALGRLLAEALPGVRPAILDVGCGVGRLHPLIAPLADRLVGVDPSGESLARARRDHPGLDYRLGSGERLPVGTGEFDIAVATCAIHHVPPALWPAVAAEMRRAVRPGGFVVLIEHNPYNPGTRLAVARCPFDADAVLLSARRARALLRGAGLAGTASRHILLLPSAAAPARRLERALEHAPLGAQYLAWGRAP